MKPNLHPSNFNEWNLKMMGFQENLHFDVELQGGLFHQNDIFFLGSVDLLHQELGGEKGHLPTSFS